MCVRIKRNRSYIIICYDTISSQNTQCGKKFLMEKNPKWITIKKKKTKKRYTIQGGNNAK